MMSEAESMAYIAALETTEDGIHILVERIATLEAARAETFGQFQHMAKVALEQQGRAEQAEAALAERDRMLDFVNPWSIQENKDKWIAHLRARAEEGGE